MTQARIPKLDAVKAEFEKLGLELHLAHLQTPSQLPVMPVHGLDYWKATLKRDGKRVCYETRNTALGAAEAALAAFKRAEHT